MKKYIVLVLLISIFTIGCSKETKLNCIKENDYSEFKIKGIALNSKEDITYYFHKKEDKPYKAEVISVSEFRTQEDLDDYLEKNKNSGSVKKYEGLILTEKYILEYTEKEQELFKSKDELIKNNSTCK